MLRLGNVEESLNVVCDQIGTPTYAKDLAKTCLDILTLNSSNLISKREICITTPMKVLPLGMTLLL